MKKNLDKLVGDTIQQVATQQSVVSVRQIDTLIEMTKQQELYKKERQKDANRKRG